MSRTGHRVIGIGNAERGDDGAGHLVAQQLLAAKLPHGQVIVTVGDGTALMEAWKGADIVMVIDAVHSGAKAGTVYRWDAHRNPIPSRFFPASTHAFGLAEAIELARALHQLPPRLIIYGIEGRQFTLGQRPSPEVVVAAKKVARQVQAELRRLDR
jgi:hydrogenase maturation protease